MKGIIRRLTASALALALILPCVSALAVERDAVAKEIATADEVGYYGREALSQHERGSVLVYAYDAIAAGVEECEADITVWDGENRITRAELEMAYDAYRRDRPEHFWLGTRYSVSYPASDPEQAIAISPEYLFEGQALAAARELFEIRVAELCHGVDASLSEFERELTLHDRLAECVRYEDSESAHNAYGAIVEGVAVCEGYAEALSVLLRRVGIESFIMTGSSINPTTGTPEGHAWCAVKIDGDYYHTDLTWNDQGETLYHAYFNVTDEVIKEDHVIENVGYVLPNFEKTDAWYWNLTDGRFDGEEYTPEAIGALLREGNNTAHIYLLGEKDDFLSWLSEDGQANFVAILGEIGLTASDRPRLSISSLGRELVLCIETCTHEALTFVLANAPDCEADGNLAYYECECGKLFSDREATEVTTRSKVHLPKLGHDFSKMTEADRYIKKNGNCQVKDTYWLACQRCGESAGNDPFAFEKFYTGTTFGEHFMKTVLDSDGEYHFYSCLVEGCSYKEGKAPCSGTAASCVRRGVCDVCENEYGDLGEHVFGEDFDHAEKGGHAHECTVKGCSAHDEIEAHEFKDGVCEACGFKESRGFFGFTKELGFEIPSGKVMIRYAAIGACVAAVLGVVIAVLRRK